MTDNKHHSAVDKSRFMDVSIGATATHKTLGLKMRKYYVLFHVVLVAIVVYFAGDQLLHFASHVVSTLGASMSP